VTALVAYGRLSKSCLRPSWRLTCATGFGAGAVSVEPLAGIVFYLVEAGVRIGESFGPGRGQFGRGAGESANVSLDSGFAPEVVREGL
jgi:hypothetical protein